jgi:hypothetical protein
MDLADLDYDYYFIIVNFPRQTGHAGSGAA